MKKTYISQSNAFVNGIYDMNISQLRVFILSLAKHKQGVDVFNQHFEISAHDLGVDVGSGRKQLKQIVDNIAEVKFRENTPDKYKVYGVFRSPEWRKKKSAIGVKLDEDIKPYVNVWTEQFTIAEVNTLLHIQTFNSYRIYMLLKQYQNLKTERTIKLDELRRILNLNTKGYQVYANFKMRILEVAKRHLKETDMAFDFDEIKAGKAVESIRFRLLTIPAKQLPEPEVPVLPIETESQQLVKPEAGNEKVFNNAVRIMRENYGFSNKQINKYLTYLKPTAITQRNHWFKKNKPTLTVYTSDSEHFAKMLDNLIEKKK